MLSKKNFFKINNKIYPIIFPIVNLLAYFFSKVTEKLYGLVMVIEWARDPSPEWMDHDQDYFYQSRLLGKTFFLERGSLPKILASQLVRDKKNIKSLNVLDLCCGDGFFSEFFLHDIAKNITLIDLDTTALDRAKKRYKRLNFLKHTEFNFIKSDILNENIEDTIKKNKIDIKFDLIIFNAAIEHFSSNQVDKIFESCKKLLSTKAIIFGYTLVEDEDHAFDHHELFFSSKEDLKKLVSKNFSNVECFESLSDSRHNLYFVAKNF